MLSQRARQDVPPDSPALVSLLSVDNRGSSTSWHFLSIPVSQSGHRGGLLYGMSSGNHSCEAEGILKDLGRREVQKHISALSISTLPVTHGSCASQCQPPIGGTAPEHS